MIRMAFNNSNERLVAALRTKGPRLVEAETQTLDRLMLELQRVIQRKVTGEVLHSRRGAAGLAGSIHKDDTVQVAGEIRGRVTGGGGPFWWLSVHEKGGEKSYEILPGAVTGKSDKRALAFFPTGSIGAGFRETAMTRLRFALGKRRGELRPTRYGEFGEAGGVVVKRVEHPPLPKRAVMGPALEEMRGEIVRRVFETAAKVIR